MKKETRPCEHCGQAMAGRIDKRFCSDQCRAMAHNRNKQKNQGEQMVRRINLVLRRNRALLRHLSPQGKSTVSRQFLEQAGFAFGYHTNHYVTQRGNTYTFCYDYGYLLLPEEKVLIVNWQPYMEGKGGGGN